MNRHLRGVLLGSTSMTLAIAASSGAYAQEVLETVIVTAEKTASDIQKTSVSMEAIQPDASKQIGAVRLGDIMEMVPAVSVLQQGAGAARPSCSLT